MHTGGCGNLKAMHNTISTLGSVLPQSPVSSAQSLVEVVGPTLQSWSPAMNPGVVVAAPVAIPVPVVVIPPAVGAPPGTMGAVPPTSAPHWGVGGGQGGSRRGGLEGGEEEGRVGRVVRWRGGGEGLGGGEGWKVEERMGEKQEDVAERRGLRDE